MLLLCMHEGRGSTTRGLAAMYGGGEPQVGPVAEQLGRAAASRHSCGGSGEAANGDDQEEDENPHVSAPLCKTAV
jgi:hypothetical protein